MKVFEVFGYFQKREIFNIIIDINKEVEFRGKKLIIYLVCFDKCLCEFCNRIFFIQDLGFWFL